jgi:hypothetical protein
MEKISRKSKTTPEQESTHCELSLLQTGRTVLGSDPYNTATHKAIVPTPTKAASGPSLRIAGFRVELERALTSMEALAATLADSADTQAAEQRRQLRDAMRFIDDAIDRLMPLEDQLPPR